MNSVYNEKEIKLENDYELYFVEELKMITCVVLSKLTRNCHHRSIRSPYSNIFGKHAVKNKVHQLRGFLCLYSPARDKSWDLFNGTYKSGFTII